MAEWDKAMEISTSQVAKKAKQQEDIIKEIKASALDAAEKAKKEKTRADDAEQVVKVLQKSLEKDKSALQKDKYDLLSKIDLLEAELQMSKDLRAQEIDDAREESIDNAWYRL